MNRKDLILVGAGGHARSCIDVIQREGAFNVAAIIGLPGEVGMKIFDIEVIGTDSDLDVMALHYQYAFLGLGQIRTPQKRIKIFSELKAKGFTLPSIISPESFFSPYSNIGEGSIVMHGGIVNAGVTIGDNCIINSKALIEHDSQIGDHCHISTGAILNGNTSVGSGSFIGSGAVIKNGIQIGSNTTIGMGLAVSHNLSDSESFLGAF